MECKYNKVAALESMAMLIDGVKTLVGITVTCKESKFIAYIDTGHNIQPEDVVANYSEVISDYGDWKGREGALRVTLCKTPGDLLLAVSNHVKQLTPCRVIVWQLQDFLEVIWTCARINNMVGIHYDFISSLDKVRYINGHVQFENTSMLESRPELKKTVLSDLSIKEPYDIFSKEEHEARDAIAQEDPLRALTESIINTIGIEILQEKAPFIY